MPVLVVDLNDRRPLWAIPGWAVDRIRDAVPDGWSVRVVDAPADGSGDGAGGGPSAEALDAAADAEVYLGFGVPPELVRAAPGLRWAHTGTAGVAASLTPELARSDVVFTNSAGIHGPPVAETVVAFCLHFARGLDLAVEARRERRWRPEAFHGAESPVRELSRSTVGILGYGGIGGEVGTRVAALGARVVATRRRPDRAREPGGGGPGATGEAEITGPEGTRELLARADYVVVAAPETRETRGIIDADALARMKPGAVLVNVSRGALVDEDALVDALRDDRIRGAGLDVFRSEPLPEDHPLWALPNVVITPHVSACSRGYWEREVALIEENLRRYLRGRPLRNRVDPAAGY